MTPEEKDAEWWHQWALEQRWLARPWTRPGWVAPMPPAPAPALSADDAKAKLAALRVTLAGKRFSL